MLTEVHSYYLGELLFLAAFLGMALVSAFTTAFLIPDRRTVAQKQAAQALVDAAPVRSATAARIPARSNA